MTQSDRIKTNTNQDIRHLQDNRDRVDQALTRLLVPGLKRFIQDKMKNAYPTTWEDEAWQCLDERLRPKNPPINWNDPLALLWLIKKQWRDVFQNHLDVNIQNVAGELISVRHPTQHNDLNNFKDLETLMALHHIDRLLSAVSAHKEAKEAQQQVQDILRQCQESVVTSLNWQRKFQPLIEKKTEGFVGREFVYKAIEDFLTSQPNGYFIIEAEPGMGKSAILAKYVQDHKCIAHFNERSRRYNRADEFFESACTQLITRYDLPYSALPKETKRHRDFFADLLLEVSAKLKSSERLVIAIDALDEVEKADRKTGENILYLPTSPPKGVYFLLTQRPGTPPLRVNTPQRQFDLMQYQSESLQDIQTYIRGAIERASKLRAWISSQGLSVEDFITTLAEKSENNFMYLRYVLPELESGMYQDLSIKVKDLPQGLQAYYYQHWEHMGMTADPLPMFKIKVVYILSETPVPIPFEEILEILEFDGEEKKDLPIIVQRVLDEWREFLNPPEELYGQTHYSIYHASFRDFLHDQKIIKAAGITLQEIIDMMASSMRQGMIGNG